MIPRLETTTSVLLHPLDDIVSLSTPKLEVVTPDQSHTALDRGLETSVLALLEWASKGGDARFKSLGISYVSVAIHNERLDVAKHLVYDLDALLYEGENSLREAIITTAEESQVKICKLLLEYGEQKKLLCDSRGENIISNLIQSGRAGFMVEVLPLRKAEAWIDGINLCMHAKSKNIQNARKIIKEGKAYLNVVDKGRHTPLHHAVRNGQAELVRNSQMIRGWSWSLACEAADGVPCTGR